MPPPAQRGEALARSVFREASLTDGPPSNAILSLAATLPGIALPREAPAGTTSDDLSRTLPAVRRLVAPTSDPPASDVVIHDRKDFGPLLPAAGARAPSPRPEAPRGGGATTAAAPPRPPSRSSAESVIEIAPAPVRRDRRPPVRPTDLWMVRLVVPLALVIGLALGVLAFFLSR